MKERLSLADEEQHNLTKAMKGQYAVTDKFLARIEAFKLEVSRNNLIFHISQCHRYKPHKHLIKTRIVFNTAEIQQTSICSLDPLA